MDPGPVILEPLAKNTAPAILAASLYAYKLDQEFTLLVAPSDHLISDVSSFHKAIKIGLTETKKGRLVTFGIKPTGPETGYGYLEYLSSPSEGVEKIIKFIEKPDISKAKRMFQEGNFYWNAGIFLFRASDIISAFKQHSPEMLSNVERALENSHSDLGFLRLDLDAWNSVENISIDFAIMEKSQKIL